MRTKREREREIVENLNENIRNLSPSENVKRGSRTSASTIAAKVFWDSPHKTSEPKCNRLYDPKRQRF